MAAVGLDYNSIWDSANSLQGAIQNIIDVATGEKDWWTGELKEEIENVNNVLPKTLENLLAVQSAGDDIAGAFFDVSEKAGGITTAINEIPDREFDPTQVKQSLDDLLSIPLIEDGLNIEIKAQADGSAIYSWVDDAGNIHFSDQPGAGALTDLPEVGVLASIDMDEKKAEETVNKTKTYIEEIKVAAETIQTAMEWDAKINIAEIEATTKQMENAFLSVDNTITNTSGLIGDMLSVWTSDDLSFVEKSQARTMLEEQLELQKAGVEMQEKLITAQVAYLKARATASENGDAFMNITVDDSVTPALKAFMFEIVNLMQVEGAAMADQFLLGLPT
jgi:hypothetical protein